MKRVTKSRINAVQNAGAWLEGMDFESGLSKSEIDDHEKIGKLLVNNAKEVVKFLIQKQASETIKI